MFGNLIIKCRKVGNLQFLGTFEIKTLHLKSTERFCPACSYRFGEFFWMMNLPALGGVMPLVFPDASKGDSSLGIFLFILV